MAINAETYSYTFTKTTFTANGTQNLNGVNWTISGDGGYWGYDNNATDKGQQLGSGSLPYKNLTMSLHRQFENHIFQPHVTPRHIGKAH